MHKHDCIAVLDFGGQYSHLIANRIRRLGVFCEILPCETSPENLKEFKGIIFSGGPSSVYKNNTPKCSKNIFNLGIPILGICYGHQLICHLLGGTVTKGNVYEYGPAIIEKNVDQKTTHPLLQDAYSSSVWMSHGDQIELLPKDFNIIASTNNCQSAAFACDSKKIYGIQFHPEVTHTVKGQEILNQFLNLCQVNKTWNMKNYQEDLKQKIKQQCQNKKVFLLVSGGVDSTVCFALLNHILGSERVIGLHINNGFMRKNESQQILDFMKKEGFNNLKYIDASISFLSALKNEYKPETKRKIIGSLFLKVLDSTIQDLELDPNEWIMAQGTTYPDTIESGGTDKSATIKTHHNRVPEALKRLEEGIIIEPIAELYKDEVRQLGLEYGVPDYLIWRHPFPGPGLAVRLLCHSNKETQPTSIDLGTEKIIQEALSEANLTGSIMPVRSVGVQGDFRTYAHPLLIHNIQSWKHAEDFTIDIVNRVSKINRVVWEVGSIKESKITQSTYELIEQYCSQDKLTLLQEVDSICTQLLIENNLYSEIWQMPVILLPLQISQKPTVLIRPISSSEAMTANFFQIDQKILTHLWSQLQKIGIGALWYDLTHKPPSTIEWE